MSKQSNQRYRKEKEAEHLQKANVGSSVTNSNQDNPNQNKFNREFEAQSDNSNK